MKTTLQNDHYTYRVNWSEEDGEHVGPCTEFPSLSWLSATPGGALNGIRKLVAEVAVDLLGSGEEVPRPLATRPLSGKFVVRVPPDTHRDLAMEAGVSLNRLASAKLTR